jgi:cyanophycinase
MRRSTIIVVLGLSLSCATASRHDRPAAQFAIAIAAPRGSLVIVGGGPLGEAITRKFIELAGGAERARILVLPMASSLPETGPESVEEFKKRGVSAWSMNLTRDEAMRAETRHALDSATGMLVSGRRSGANHGGARSHTNRRGNPRSLCGGRGDRGNVSGCGRDVDADAHG